jgi:hypothetical protein
MGVTGLIDLTEGEGLEPPSGCPRRIFECEAAQSNGTHQCPIRYAVRVTRTPFRAKEHTQTRGTASILVSLSVTHLRLVIL